MESVVQIATLVVFALVLIFQVFATVSAANAAGAAQGQLKRLRPIIKVPPAVPIKVNNVPVGGSFNRGLMNVGSATAFDLHARVTFFDADNVVLFQAQSRFDQDLPAGQDAFEGFLSDHPEWGPIFARLGQGHENGIHYRVDVRYRFDPAAVEWYGSTGSAQAEHAWQRGQAGLEYVGYTWGMLGTNELDRPALGRLFPVNEPQ